MDDIQKLYENAGYFELYADSFVLFFLMILLLTLFFVFMNVMSNANDIRRNWNKERCKPSNIVFSGFIKKDEPTDSILEATQKNFTFCLNEFMKTSPSLGPIGKMQNTAIEMFGNVSNNIQNIRSTLSYIREKITEITKNIMQRIMNVITPFIVFNLTFQDTLKKINGVFSIVTLTSIGSYYTLRSFFNLIIKMVITIMIVIIGIISAYLSSAFFSWMAGPFIALFVVITALLISFQNSIVKSTGGKGMKIPKLKCFSGNTEVRVYNDKNAKNSRELLFSKKEFKDLKPGDLLRGGNYINAVIKLSVEGETMFQIGNNIRVSGSHKIYDNEKGKWVNVSNHKEAIKTRYDDKYIYCINTSNKIINIDGRKFLDWDELDEEKIEEILKIKINNECIKYTENINRLLDEGFDKNTLITILKKNNSVIEKQYKKITEIEVGDELDYENGNKVYGVVKMMDYKEPKNSYFLEDYLYNLITDKGYFYILNRKVQDYNYSIDKFF